MTRVIIALLGLVFVGSLVGCHAEGDVDHPRSAAYVMPGR